MSHFITKFGRKRSKHHLMYTGGAAYAAACATYLPHRSEGLLLSVPFVQLGGSDGLSGGMSKKSRAILLDVRNRPWKVKILLFISSFLQRSPFKRLLLRLGGFAEIDIQTHKRYPKEAIILNKAGRHGNKHGLKGHFRDLEVMSLHPFPEEALGNTTCRAVVWAGQLDLTTPVAMAQAYVQALPNAKLHIVPDMGHFLGMKHGLEVLKSIYV